MFDRMMGLKVTLEKKTDVNKVIPCNSILGSFYFDPYSQKCLQKALLVRKTDLIGMCNFISIL